MTTSSGSALPDLPDLNELNLGPRMQELADLRMFKFGLDLRFKDIEDGRRRAVETQQKLNETLSAYGAMRTGLQAEISDLGQAGRQLGENLETQRAVLERQKETLLNERLARDVMRDEARRMRDTYQQQPVPEGVAEGQFRPVPPGVPLWGAGHA
mmetsp:Transcript_117978/g.185396  ORF Transcript_117978/g.185396 Transcript_117978/m.185396 type:complete len:155 (+) Transcript_117978:93-557(+)